MDVTNSGRCHLEFIVPRLAGVGVDASVRARWSAGARRWNCSGSATWICLAGRLPPLERPPICLGPWSLCASAVRTRGVGLRPLVARTARILFRAGTLGTSVAQVFREETLVLRL